MAMDWLAQTAGDAARLLTGEGQSVACSLPQRSGRWRFEYFCFLLTRSRHGGLRSRKHLHYQQQLPRRNRRYFPRNHGQRGSHCIQLYSYRDPCTHNFCSLSTLNIYALRRREIRR